MLHETVLNRRKKDISFLLDCGADIDATDSCGQTPLHVAARYGKTKVIQLILENGPDVNATDNYQRTPFHVATQFAGTEVIELLLKNGANVNATDNYQGTPLHLAIKFDGKTEVIELLLKNGANVNATGDDQRTPFLKKIRAELEALDEIKYDGKSYIGLSFADVTNKMDLRDQLFCMIARNREIMERVRYPGFVDDSPIFGRCVLYKLEQGALKLSDLSLATQKMMSGPFKESYFNKFPVELIEKILNHIDRNQLKEIANIEIVE